MANAIAERSGWRMGHMAALLVANAALALGPLWVRLADTGPVAAGFWRLILALPVFVALAAAGRQPIAGLPRTTLLAVVTGAVFFSLDLSSWHVGIELTRMGNATLFGNSGSILLVAWGLIALRRAPRPSEWTAFAAAIAGSAILLGRSLEIDRTTLIGDLLCLLAGFLYTFYILFLQRARDSLGAWSSLVWVSLAAAPVMLGIALLRGEPVWPHDWSPVLLFALTSQVIGQGLLVYSLRHFSPLVVGLALLTQPAVAVVLGWQVFGEVLAPLDLVGMALVALGLVLARGSERAPV